MSIFRMSRREKALARIAPISEKPGTDRRTRIAVLRAKRSKAMSSQFAHQQAFDKAVVAVVQTIPVSTEIAEWFRNEKLIPKSKRRWRKVARNPAVLSVALATAVIIGVITLVVVERLKDFPGSGMARKMLTVASSTRGAELERLETNAGALGDLFFMKYRLEHYDVPQEFADIKTAGVRVFDDDEGRRVAQISVPEKRMQFFIFPAERNAKDGKPREFSGWKYLEHEGWAGVAKFRAGVVFMAAMRGEEKDLAPYVAQAQ